MHNSKPKISRGHWAVDALAPLSMDRRMAMTYGERVARRRAIRDACRAAGVKTTTRFRSEAEARAFARDVLMPILAPLGEEPWIGEEFSMGF